MQAQCLTSNPTYISGKYLATYQWPVFNSLRFAGQGLVLRLHPNTAGDQLSYFLTILEPEIWQHEIGQMGSSAQLASTCNWHASAWREELWEVIRLLQSVPAG